MLDRARDALHFYHSSINRSRMAQRLARSAQAPRSLVVAQHVIAQWRPALASLPQISIRNPAGRTLRLMNHTLRITDGYRHAEEFDASDLHSFRVGLSAALRRFVEWRVAQFPEYQTRNRDVARRSDPMLHLHVHVARDGWMTVVSYPQAWGLGYRGAGEIPAANGRNLFRSSARLWDCVLQTVDQGKAIDAFAKSIVDEQAAPILRLV